MGQRSVAILIFAHVEHPHFLHLPVPFHAEEIQCSQSLHIDFLFNISSCVEDLNLDFE